MTIYFLQCITNNFHTHAKEGEILYIGKDSTGNRVYQHTFNLEQKQGLIYDYLNQAAENIDYFWRFEEVEDKKQLTSLERQLIHKHQPQFNTYLKGKKRTRKITKSFAQLEKEKFQKYELGKNEIYKKDLNNHFLTIKKVYGHFGETTYQAIITKQNSKKAIWSMVATSLDELKKNEIFCGLVKQYMREKTKT